MPTVSKWASAPASRVQRVSGATGAAICTQGGENHATAGDSATPGTGREATLTHFADGEGAGVAGVDLRGAPPREVEQLHQARHHLVLLLRVAQPAVAAKAPGEDALLGVQDQLQGEETRAGTSRPPRGVTGPPCLQESLEQR